MFDFFKSKAVRDLETRAAAVRNVEVRWRQCVDASAAGMGLRIGPVGIHLWEDVASRFLSRVRDLCNAVDSNKLENELLMLKKRLDAYFSILICDNGERFQGHQQGLEHVGEFIA